MTETLRYKVTIAASPERVWEALTTPEGSRATLYGCLIESSFEVGSRVEFVSYGAGGERTVQVYGDIEAFEPPRRFAYIQHPGAVHNEQHVETMCRMTHVLTPHEDGTELELTLDQWSDENPAYEHAKSAYPESDYLKGIKAYAESPKPQAP
ncbi:SRPBCC domain-containing protein [Streptomyces sp. NPDC020096]